jgi:hypothetical protein
VHLRSRNDNDFSIRYPAIVKGLAKLPDGTVIDGEVIALDEDGRPSFNVLQNYGSSKAPVVYFVFDLMMLAGQDVMNQPLTARRQLLEHKVLPRLTDPVRYAGPLGATLPVLIESVKAQGLESLVTKRLDSRYESGLRTGAWQKMRINRGQEFVVGGYILVIEPECVTLEMRARRAEVRRRRAWNRPTRRADPNVCNRSHRVSLSDASRPSRADHGIRRRAREWHGTLDHERFARSLRVAPASGLPLSRGFHHRGG